MQKNFDHYGKYENANKVDFYNFDKYLDSLPGNEEGIFWKRIFPIMKSITTDAVRGTYPKIDPNRREMGFELYGLDFMVDESYKVWLIEMNTNPAINVNCSV